MENSDESQELSEIYREIEEDLDVNQAKYANPTRNDDDADDELKSIANRLESAFPSLEKSNDVSLAVTDASLARRIALIGSIRTLASSSNRDENKLKKYLSVLVNWKANGENVWKRLVESPGIGRKGHGAEILAVAELIKSRKKDDPSSEEKVSEKSKMSTDSGAEELYGKLSTSLSDNSIPIKKLDLVDKQSFSKTIENFYNFSVLVSEQRVDLGKNEDCDVTCRIGKPDDSDTDDHESPQEFVHGAIVLRGKDWLK